MESGLKVGYIYTAHDTKHMTWRMVIGVPL